MSPGNNHRSVYRTKGHINTNISKLVFNLLSKQKQSMGASASSEMFGSVEQSKMKLLFFV